MKPTGLHNTVKYLKQIINSNKIEEKFSSEENNDPNNKINGPIHKCNVSYIAFNNSKDTECEQNEQKVFIDNEVSVLYYI